MFLEKTISRRWKKWTLELLVCHIGRSLVSLAKFLMEPGTEPGIHDARIPSDIYLENKSRQWNVQSCSKKNSCWMTELCSQQWSVTAYEEKITRISGYIMKRKIFRFLSFSSSFTDSTSSKISKISSQLITQFYIHGESWHLSI